MKNTIRVDRGKFTGNAVNRTADDGLRQSQMVEKGCVFGETPAKFKCGGLEGFFRMLGGFANTAPMDSGAKYVFDKSWLSGICLRVTQELHCTCKQSGTTRKNREKSITLSAARNSKFK